MAQKAGSGLDDGRTWLLHFQSAPIWTPLWVVLQRGGVAMGASPGGARRPRRLDILVQPEQIGWVILLLQADQARVFAGAVGRTHPVLAFVAHVIDVGTAGGKGLHPLPEVPGP